MIRDKPEEGGRGDSDGEDRGHTSVEELIRQGQEALGTKFSVEGDGDDEQTDEGFVDEGW